MENAHLLGAMEIFISVVDCGSFSQSARRLGISQPSVSRQINALEDYLGLRLLQRTTRRLSLTEAGEVYYEKVRQIQRDVEDATHSIAGFKENPAGVLKISAPHTWTELMIAPHLDDFLTRFPDIKLDIECNDQFQDMVEDRLDLLIRVGVPKDSSYVAVPMAKIKMVICASPDYLEKYGVPPTAKDLQNHNCILFETFTTLMVNDAGNGQEITLSGNVVANTVPVMLSAAEQGIGFTVLPDLLVRQHVAQGKLQILMQDKPIEIKNLPIDQIFALYSNRRHLAAKVRVFIDFFKERFQQFN